MALTLAIHPVSMLALCRTYLTNIILPEALYDTCLEASHESMLEFVKDLFLSTLSLLFTEP